MSEAASTDGPLFPASEGTFFRSRWVQAPDGVEQLDPARLAPGFRAGAAACGIKGGGEKDVGVIVCDAEGVSSALLLTRNASAAAPVRVCREHCDGAAIRAAVVNSGNANAATGEQGIKDALAMQQRAAEDLGLEASAVAVAETGAIGVPLPIQHVLEGIPQAGAMLSPEGGAQFAEAIMTTDRGPKQCSLRCDGVTVSAQAKGAGMIEPGFATMLCFVQTNGEIAKPEGALRSAVEGSFERISVDGQMSTNDTVLLQSSGEAGKSTPEGLLDAVLLQLALEVVADGEGATRVCRVEVRDAAKPAEAEEVARAIGNSPLVKTALFGRDPNWGRISQAAGQALAGEELPELGPDRIDAKELAGDEAEPELSVRLGRGKASAHLYFSDLNHEYIRINAEYTT
ncbi:MAG: bifunctional glutamate N-acetyltransferase/amino-acid acetyltransferase ArgJ [Solirubrobacterales bacterium]|nr:bifunctional glutamate N-acetyltransferase/amino-acid acetyltransferase ArgJ [Solirubrobacterales bacterium]